MHRTASLHSGIYLEARADLLNLARGGRSLRTVAKRAGCAASVLCELETGVKPRASAELAHRIEDALGVDRGTLFRLAAADAELLRPYLLAQPA